MPVTLEQLLDEMPQERRDRIEALAAEIREELNLRELRRLRKLTQTRLSKKLKIGQEGVSRIEKRTDLYLSTLRSYVEAVGGKLSLLVEFPDHAPIALTGLGEDSPKTVRKRTRKRAAAAAKSKTTATKPKSKSRRAA